MTNHRFHIMVIPPGGVMEMYLPYYEGRYNIRTLYGLIFENHGDIAAAFRKLHEQIDASTRGGLAVLASGDALKLPEDIFYRYPVTQAELDAFWAPYRTAFEPIVIHKGTTYYWRIASGTTAAQNGGWQWHAFDLGWQAINTNNPDYTNGMCFDPQPDPILLGPLMSLDAEGFKAIEITLSTQAHDQTAQLFWAGPDGATTDAHSVQWPVQGDGQMHTYAVPLPGAPAWSGTITRLRLDPIAVGDGTAATRTCVASFRLLQQPVAGYTIR